MSIHHVRQAEEYVVCPTLVCDDLHDKGKSLSVKVPNPQRLSFLCLGERDEFEWAVSLDLAGAPSREISTKILVVVNPDHS